MLYAWCKPWHSIWRVNTDCPLIILLLPSTPAPPQITNFFVTPVNGKFFMTELELDAIRTGKKTDTLQAAEEADVEDRSSR